MYYFHLHIQVRICYHPHLALEEAETGTVQGVHSPTAREWGGQGPGLGLPDAKARGLFTCTCTFPLEFS